MKKKPLRGIALQRKGRCRLRGPPLAESFVNETLFRLKEQRREDNELSYCVDSGRRDWPRDRS